MNCWTSWAPTDFSLLVGIEGIQRLLGDSAFTPCTCWLQCLHFVVTSSQINLSNLLVIYCSPRCLQHAGLLVWVFFWNWNLHLCCRLRGLVKLKWENLDQRKSSGNGSTLLFLSTELHSDETFPRWSSVVSLLYGGCLYLRPVPTWLYRYFYLIRCKHIPSFGLV